MARGKSGQAGRGANAHCRRRRHRPQVGLRGYNVCRQLRLLGYDAANLTGGWKTYQAMKAASMVPGAANGAAKL